MIMTLEEIASRINGQLQGDGSVEITGINNITGARAGDITFADEIMWRRPKPVRQQLFCCQQPLRSSAGLSFAGCFRRGYQS